MSQGKEFFIEFLSFLIRSLEVSSPLPAKKKARTSGTSITSYFNTSKKPDDEQKENQSPHSFSKTHPTPILINDLNPSKKRRSKGKQEAMIMPTDTNVISSVQVEKTSLILFDEVRRMNCFFFFFMESFLALRLKH